MMPTDDPQQHAIGAWTAALSSNGVRTGPEVDTFYGPNITEYRGRRIVAALLPRNRHQVEQVLSIANQFRVPLYPMSTGRNWGLGSKLPIRDGCAIVDLSKMRRILHVDPTHRVAVVEPGVTQKQLACHLAACKIALMVNVTGSGGDTSLLGNALERGVGVMGQRNREIRGLEVVLGTGQTIHTGLARWAPDFATAPHHYPQGVGPDLTELFVQSNLGIVTAAALELRPAQVPGLMFLEVPDERLDAAVDELSALRAEGVLDDRIEIDTEDDPRLHGMLGRRSASRTWAMWVPLRGSQRLIAARREELQERLANAVAASRFYPPGAAAEPSAPEALRVRFDLACGVPSDWSIESLARAHGVDAGDVISADIDHFTTIPGFVCVLPAVPFHGADLRRVVTAVDQVSQRCEVVPYQSYNTVSTSCFEGYIRASFVRADAAAVARAHRWCAELHQRFRAESIWPIRLNIEQMGDFTQQGTGFDDAVARIKAALDPSGIIAPGRYGP
jgi:4-cresol dehydrogenase (hydroxylating) flavoprotein subunit